MIKYNVLRTRPSWKENKEFKLVRTSGTDDYLLLHFKTPVIFNLSGEEYKVSAGSCILLTPGTPHAFYPVETELVHDWMHFIPSDETEFLKSGLKFNAFFKPVDVSFITTACKKCESELIYKDDSYEEMISSEVTKMFVKLKRLLKENENTQHSESFKLLRYEIYQNPQNFQDTVCMAEKVELSRSRFSVVYKEIFGISPKEDLIKARVAKASYLLSLGTLALSEISDMCGYQNIYHFIRQFKQITGQTPGEYRKNF